MTRLVADCSVAVVGGCGFLGSHLVEHLLGRDCRVVVLDNLCAGRREFIPPTAHFVHADITGSERELYNVFRDHKVKYVFNYAALPYIPVSFRRPLHVFEVNAVGAMKVINAAQEAGAEAVLQISSAELYGQEHNAGATNGGTTTWTGKINESYPVTPHSAYGAAKAAVDFFCQAAWRERATPVIALRQFNCMGERETHPYVAVEIINQLMRGDGSTIYLGNNSVRDFLYAGDQAVMARELLEKGKFGEVYNLGSEKSIHIYELAQKIADKMGCGLVKIVEDPSRVRPWEIWHLQSDNSKVYGVIESRPQVSLDEAITRTLRYFHGNGNQWCWEQ